jgi:hypothetical protein
MQNDFRQDFALTPYFRENKLSQYLQSHEEVLWECHTPSNPRLFWQIIVAELIIIFISPVIFDSILKFAAILISCLFAIPITLIAHRFCFGNATHYLLTPSRFLVLYYEGGESFNPKKRKVENIDFSQVVELRLTKESIKIISPILYVAKITPQRDLQWLYDELLQRWEHARQWASQSDVLALEQMYRPPMKRYRVYVLVFSILLIPVVFIIFSPFFFGWPPIITNILTFILVGYNFTTQNKTSWLQTLIMGNDYRNVKHAPVYSWLNTVSLFSPISVIGLLFLFFHH